MSEFEEFFSEDIHKHELKGVTFHFVLPNRDNLTFQRAVNFRLFEYDPETDEFARHEVNPAEMVAIQQQAFAETCIRQVDGWDFTPVKLLAMPPALEALWIEVSRLNIASEKEAQALVKKLESTLTGPEGGPDTVTITSSSSDEAA